MANGCSPDHHGAIGNGIGYGCEVFGICKDGRGANSRLSVSKRYFIRVHDAKLRKPKIAHRTSSCPNIEWIPRRHQDDAKKLQFFRLNTAAIYLNKSSKPPEANNHLYCPLADGFKYYFTLQFFASGRYFLSFLPPASLQLLLELQPAEIGTRKGDALT